jgi:hypothetical protein
MPQRRTSVVPPAKPPIDERRIEELRRDPEVIFHQRADPNHRWSFKPVLQVIEPVSAHELIGRDDDDIP